MANTRTFIQFFFIFASILSLNALQKNLRVNNATPIIIKNNENGHYKINDDVTKTIHSLLTDIKNTLNSSKINNNLSSDKCTLSYDKLEELKEAIDDAMTADDQTNAIDCDVNVNNPDGSCNELIEFIQCGIEEMSDAVDDAKSDGEKLAILQKQYIELQIQYQQFIDDHENEISDAAQKIIDDLKEKMQELQDYLDKVIKVLVQELIENISDRIERNDITTAVDKFIESLDLKLDYVVIIEGVIDTAYNGDFAANAMKFLKALPTDAYSNIGYTKIIDLMTANDQLTSVYLFKYYEAAAPDDDRTERIENFKNKLSDEYFKQIDSIAAELRDKNVDNVNKVMDVLETGKFFILDAIIAAFTDQQYFDNIVFTAIDMKSKYKGGCIALASMYDAMKVNNLLESPTIYFYESVLELQCHWFIDDAPYDSSELPAYEICLKQIDRVRNNIPIIVKQLNDRNSKCKIMTMNGDGVLAVKSNDDEEYRRHVYIQNSNSADETTWWKIFSPDGTNIFVMVNDYYQERLTFIDDEDLFQDVKVFVYSRDDFYVSDNQRSWILYPHENATVFRINIPFYQKDIISNWPDSEDIATRRERRASDNYVWKLSCE